MINIAKTKKVNVALAFLLISAILSVFILPQFASAAALTSMKDTQTRLKLSTAGNHTIQFTTPTGIANGNTVTLTFQSGFNIASVVTGDVTLEGAAVTSAVPAGQVLTITAGAGNVVAAAGTADIVISNNHITNPGTIGSYTIAIAGTFNDTGTLAVAIATEDQVSITATVNPYIAFNVTDATVALGTLDPTTVKTDTAAMTAATNSTSGYSITVYGPTLTSGANTITAIGGTATASNPGTEQFGMKIGVSGGSGAAVAPYNTANYAYDGMSSADQCATSAGVSTTTTFTMTYMANIAFTSEPGSYSAIHTYICTGTF